MPERLQKWLATAGVGSRRQVDAWIAEGRVRVNGKPAVPGQKVSGTERIMVDGRVIAVLAPRHQPRPRVILYHKPVGEVCTRTDPEGRPTVFEALPKLGRGRWVIVGRLDIDTSGLLLFTTDGTLANALMHPSGELVREYAVRVHGRAAPDDLRRLREGVELEDGPARFELLEEEGGEGANRWYRVSVAEGRNRIVRRLWEAVGCQVARLMRVRFGPVELPRHLPRGRWRDIQGRELEELYVAVGLAAPEAITANKPEKRARKVAPRRRRRPE